MSENLQNILQNALNNNSYDYDVMHETLKNTWQNSYSHLYGLQKDLVEYEELFYYSNDEVSHNSELIGKLYLDKLDYACFDVKYDFIQVYDREDFRLSKYYRNKFTVSDIYNHPEIFFKMPVIVIDDKVIWDYSIYCNKDCTSITLPFKRQFVVEDNRNPDTDEYIYKDHKIQVFVVDNVYYERKTLNKSHLNYNGTTREISFVNTLLSKVPTQDGTMFCSVHYPNESGKGYELGTFLIPLTKTEDGYKAMLSADINAEMLKSTRDFYVSFFFFNRLYSHTFYTGKANTACDANGETELMVLEKLDGVPYDMPIPVEDFLILKGNETTGYKAMKNVDMLTLYYPNIYRITDVDKTEGDTYQIFYFYYNSNEFSYTPIHDFYYKYLRRKFSTITNTEELLDKIYRGTLVEDNFTEGQATSFKETFTKIMNYQYFNHQYGEMDFLKRYQLIPGNEDKEPIEYKDEIMKAWIKEDPDMLGDYVKEQQKLGSSYHLFTKTLDLPSRVRNNTVVEMGTQTAVFQEPRYVFAFNNEREYPAFLNVRVFVDGIFVGDLYEERKFFMEYFYIPCSMVTDDSYIEIEIFPSYQFSKEIEFTSLDQKEEISILDHEDTIFPTIADVYLVDNEDPTHRYDERFFDFTEIYSRADITAKTIAPEKPVKFTRLNKFYLQPNNEKVLNVPMTLYFNKIEKGTSVLITRAGYPYLQFVENAWKYSSDYIRVFKNGRLMPRCKYTFYSSFGCPRIQLLDWCEPGDIIYMDITPYRYTEVYYEEDIESGDKIIDLKGVINKPFDIRYYDVYINGRKLSFNNAFSVDPWSLTLVNLKSNYHLTIYEKERDWEYFGLDYTQNIYYFSHADLLKEGYLSEDEKRDIVKEVIESKKDDRLTIYPNTNDEEKMDYIDIRHYVIVRSFYYYELLPKTFVNPDTKQFSKVLMDGDYDLVSQYFSVNVADQANTEAEKERRKNYPVAVCLDPDITIEGAEGVNKQTVYVIGHLGEVSPELLAEKVTITDDFDISK